MQPQPKPRIKPAPKNGLDRRERARLTRMLRHEKQAKLDGFQIIAGVDEAGRGPLAGPVYAAACILPPNLVIAGLNDSKQVTPGLREEIFLQLTTNEQVIYGIGIVQHDEIDRINIYQATLKAMREAVSKLSSVPDLLLVDGLRLDYLNIECRKIIKGDCQSQSIAAASILAKVSRDRMMCVLHESWPEYGFNEHKGYSTEQHQAAIQKYGPCPIHRMTYERLKPFVTPKSVQLAFDLVTEVS